MLGKLAAVALAALVLASTAAGASRVDATVSMDDGVELQVTLHFPAGTPPAAGWPGIVMIHGLGVDRRSTNAVAETVFVPNGYAVLTYDLRGHHESGGQITLAGARELQDLRRLVELFANRADVDGDRLGAWGISYGGGHAWLAAAGGIPLKAIVTVQTWTDLFAALFPGNLPKSGVIGGLLNLLPVGKLAPELGPLRLDALLGRNLETVRQFANERSVLAALPNVRVPALMLQGRRDFAFGIEQATEAFLRIGGPKRVYFGLHGHTPAAFPAADTGYAMSLAVRWFDRFLKGAANGVDTEPNVEIAREPFAPARPPAAFAGLPPTTSLALAARGVATLRASETAVRTAGTAPRLLETFGAPVVRVTATASGGWSRIVVLLTAVTAAGRELVVGAGGVPAAAGTRTYTVPLSANVTVIPRNSRLQLTIGATTTGTAGGLLYLPAPMPAAARLRVGNATLSLPLLAAPASG